MIIWVLVTLQVLPGLNHPVVQPLNTYTTARECMTEAGKRGPPTQCVVVVVTAPPPEVQP